MLRQPSASKLLAVPLRALFMVLLPMMRALFLKEHR
jgi:hypothetical protein